MHDGREGEDEHVGHLLAHPQAHEREEEVAHHPAEVGAMGL